MTPTLGYPSRSAAIRALHQDGLQVVLDQVFNHTAASGQDPKLVLDQVVT